MSYPRYNNYKKSGIDWLGEIPNAWGISKFRHLVSPQKGKAPDELFDVQTSPKQVPYLTMDYLRCNVEEAKWMIPDSKTILATSQDVLILWDGSNAGEFITARDGAVSSTMALLSNNSLNQDYFFYFCKTVESEVKQMTIGMGIPHVNGDYLKENLIPIPTMQEQIVIAAFLNRETGKIDTLIAEQERLIELLKEKRHTTISHAVTKGLNPKVPMKDSGVQWLGQIPKHWKVSRLKQCVSLINQKAEQNTNLVALENIESWSGKFVVTDSKFEGDGIAFQIGDILFGKLRPYLAKAYLAEFPGEAIGDIYVMRPTADVCGRFFQYQLLNSVFISIVDGATFGAKMPRVSWDFMANLKITNPNRQEQTIIAAFLDSEISKIDSLIHEAKNVIELLQERRKALIFAAVTGKIDVRKLMDKE